MTHLQTPLSGDLVERLGRAVDREAKIPRALDALGPTADRDVLVLDGSAAVPAARLVGGLARVTSISATQLETPDPSVMDGSADVLVVGWSTFRGPSQAELAAAERWLRPGGRLLVVHDYGRDDVSRLFDPRPEYADWSRRDGPFLAEWLQDPGRPQLVDVRLDRGHPGVPRRCLRPAWRGSSPRA